MEAEGGAGAAHEKEASGAGENKEVAGTASTNGSEKDDLSAIMPGWFFEISPMWPGLINSLLISPSSGRLWPSEWIFVTSSGLSVYL